MCCVAPMRTPWTTDKVSAFKIIIFRFSFHIYVARAFFVKLIGEGADDHGGPYRAIFHTAIAEEAQHLLQLLTPCANATNEVAENRDKLVFNTAFTSDVGKLRLFEFLGKLLGLACRNDILVDLNLPLLVWKPLVNDRIDASDFFAIDIHLNKALEWISAGEADSDLLIQMLSSYMRESQAAELVKALSQENGGQPATISTSQLILHLNHSMHRSALAAFYKGINSIIPTELFSMFTPEELEIVFCGPSDVNIELLKEATVYDGVSASDP